MRQTETSLLARRNKRPLRERLPRDEHAAAQETEAREVVVMQWGPEEDEELPQLVAHSLAALLEQVCRQLQIPDKMM
jgi:hypothetical protein